MPLVRNGAVTSDPFTFVPDDEGLPEGAILVSAERFAEEADALLRRNAPLGITWPNNRDVAELQPYLHRLDLIALAFPKFRDGRAFSQARLLRERYGFTGEIRATGDVLQDQLLLMVRSGFDGFALAKAADADAFDAALKRYSVFYQPTGDGRRTVRAARAALVEA